MKKGIHAIYNIRFEEISFFKILRRDTGCELMEYHADIDLVNPLEEEVLIIMGGPISVNDGNELLFTKRYFHKDFDLVR